MVAHLFSQLLHLPAVWVYLVVGLVVFAEDAVFLGFVVPGETAAVLAGVAAHAGHVSLPTAIAVVVVAAVTGDAVGYEVGRRVGGQLPRAPLLRRRTRQLQAAQELLARRGGAAVFLGRFVSLFRALVPALSGAARMPLRRFLPWNAAGGVVWGTGVTLLGYLAGASYRVVAADAGRGAAVVVGGAAVTGLVVWRVRRARRHHRDEGGDDAHGAVASGEQPAARPRPRQLLRR